MISTDDTAIIIIDVQEKLCRVMNDREALAKTLRALVGGAVAMEIPLLITEQNPAGLGPTIAEVTELVPGVERLPKFSFSCCDDAAFAQKLSAVNRHNLLVAGVETHICVYQTALGLVSRGYGTQVVADCVSSRTAFNNNIGLERMKAEGVRLTSTEMALFELLKTARHEKFAAIQKLIK